MNNDKIEKEFLERENRRLKMQKEEAERARKQTEESGKYYGKIIIGTIIFIILGMFFNWF